MLERWIEIRNAVIEFAKSLEDIFLQVKDLLENKKTTRKQKFNFSQTKVKPLKSQVLLNKPKFIKAMSCLR